MQDTAGPTSSAARLTFWITIVNRLEAPAIGILALLRITVAVVAATAAAVWHPWRRADAAVWLLPRAPASCPHAAVCALLGHLSGFILCTAGGSISAAR
jgi:hypothetical protein